jgi:hypothetical protein
MAPSYGRCVCQEFVGHDFAIGAEVGDGICDIGRVPIDDGGYDEIKAGGAELLGLVGPVGDAALPMRTPQTWPLSTRNATFPG